MHYLKARLLANKVQWALGEWIEVFDCNW